MSSHRQLDDLNDWVGCLGVTAGADTEHGRLAARGTLFRNAPLPGAVVQPVAREPADRAAPYDDRYLGLAPGNSRCGAHPGLRTLPQYLRAWLFHCHVRKVFHDGSIPKRLQTNEFDVWGPAPSMPLPQAKFVTTPNNMRLMDWGVYPEGRPPATDWKIADAAIAELKSLPTNNPASCVGSGCRTCRALLASLV